jgi:hypothetical protein
MRLARAERVRRASEADTQDETQIDGINDNSVEEDSDLDEH